jgi:hypothetical protein
MSLKSALSLIKIPADFEYSKPLDSEISWIHRRSGETDLYFVANNTDKELNTDLRMRVSGRSAEIWHPETGLTEPASYRFENSKTVVPLQLSGHQSVFVVFRNKTTVESVTLEKPEPVQLAAVEGPWEISFPANLGAPEKANLPKLQSWTLNEDIGIKYFSGTATYSTSVVVPANWLKQNKKIILDLGNVGDIAELIVNGTPADTLWSSPYRANITGLFKEGQNKLEVKVTNEWTNRLSGDRLAAPGKKVLNSNLMVRPGALNESGLLGPVRIFGEGFRINR